MEKVYAVYCFVYDEDTKKVLMVYNKDNSSWSMPGGVVEENETLEQAALRELHEETGLQGEVRDIVAINECFFQNNNVHAIFITFRTELVGGKISIKYPDEISKVTWVDIPEANKLMPYHKCGIGKLIQNSCTYYNQGKV